MNKTNLSPHSITLLITSVTCSFTSVLVLLFYFFGSELVTLPFLIACLFVLVLICYYLTRFLIVRFIYNRIIPIYRFIRKNKSDIKRIPKTNELKQDIIGQLDGEVSKWEEEKSLEIANLKGLEEYRKDYVGNISHELKTPLFSVQGYIHTLLEGVEDEAIRRKFLLRASANTDRLVSIVNDLERITKIEAGKDKLKLSDFDLKTLSDEIFDDHQIQAEKNKVKLVYHDRHKGNYKVHADKEAIRQVLNNLITNSIKYGKDGGEVRLSFLDMEKHVLVEVSDNGIGIEQKHLKHLFDRFYRIEKSRNRNVGGAGLGLSIVKHIIEAHNQEINVRSELGEGTTFSFTLNKSRKAI